MPDRQTLECIQSRPLSGKKVVNLYVTEVEGDNSLIIECADGTRYVELKEVE